MNERKKSIVIVGGGTAGWMAANLMATHWQQLDFDITLVESSQIGIIGVGEGSTPALKNFMDHIGVWEPEWMPACNATYKVGITFRDWSTRKGFFSYFHPFLAQPDQFAMEAFYHNNLLRRNGIDLEAHPDHFSLAAHLARNKLSPVAAENCPFKIDYAYHFDAHLLGKFLAKKAMEKGVQYREATVSHASVDAAGNISGLNTDQGELIKADLYVDCTGFRSQLLQQALNVPFIGFADNLFNDSAVVFSTRQCEEIECRTASQAMRYGWAWSIPLTNRIGNGYVYSSDFCSADQAESEFRAHLGLMGDPVEARHIKMKVGRVQQHWAGNCLAVGLSQGFVEPLEATALDLVGLTVHSFMEAYVKGNFTAQNRDAFNAHINDRFDAVRDYIVCHYKANTRTDTDYWIENRENESISDGLKAVLSSWKSGEYIGNELKKHKLDAYFAHFSWNCLLAGYGDFPAQEALRRGKEIAYKYKLDDIKDFVHRCAMNFKPHRMQLESLRQC
ncbi:MAG: tryptophan halogenase family protein [Pseudomonadales bacterium]|nr:tryptophan halogenase family protein [Pseudomonadales bacterium]